MNRKADNIANCGLARRRQVWNNITGTSENAIGYNILNVHSPDSPVNSENSIGRIVTLSIAWMFRNAKLTTGSDRKGRQIPSMLVLVNV
jgi:hypothetical protein